MKPSKCGLMSPYLLSTLLLGAIGLKGDFDAIYRFTSGRWLWDEDQQLAARYVKFDALKLLELAASAVGSKACIKMVKLPEG